MSISGVISGEKHKELLKLLEDVRDKVKKSETYEELCKEKNIDDDLIDYVPMCFANLDVSARTENGIIYFNIKLLEKPDEIEHYMIHEFNHVLQQCLGDGPTPSINQNNYLNDGNEKESFQYQTDYIAEVDGEKAADDYVEQVLDHHNVDNGEKEKRKKQLRSYYNSVKKVAVALPPKDLNAMITAWAQNSLASYVYEESEKILSTIESEVGKFYIEEIKNLCAEYISGTSENMQLYPLSTDKSPTIWCTSFEIDTVLGWDKFKHIVGKNNIFKSYQEILDVLINTYGWPDEIPVCMSFLPLQAEEAYTGTWYSKTFGEVSPTGLFGEKDEAKHVYILADVNSIFNTAHPSDSLKLMMNRVATTVRHELQHMFQEISRDVFGEGSVLEYDVEYEPGLMDTIARFKEMSNLLPNNAVNTLGKLWAAEDGATLYALKTILYDSLSDIEKKDVIDISNDTGQQIIDVMIDKYFTGFWVDDFMKKLKEKDYDKWKNAAKIFSNYTGINIQIERE